MSDSESSDDLPLAQRAKPNGNRRSAPAPGSMKDAEADADSGDVDVSEAEESGSDIERAKPKTKAKQPARTGARTTPANCVTAAHLYPVAAFPTCVLAWKL